MLLNQKAEIKSLRIENEELGAENDELAEENELLKADLKRFLQVKQETIASKGHPSGEHVLFLLKCQYVCYC